MVQTRLNKWDNRFLDLAKHISIWSKDPSTACGCVITDSKQRVVSMGFNGLPRHVKDTADRLMDRETKLMLTIHAEENAILFANRQLDNCTAYVWPMPPCAKCAGKLIQSGITRIVSVSPRPDALERWGKELDLAYEMYQEAGVTVDIESLA